MIPDFGKHRIKVEGIDLECSYVAPGLTFQDLSRIFHKAEEEWKEMDDFAADPGKWKNHRGINAVKDAILNVIYGDEKMKDRESYTQCHLKRQRNKAPGIWTTEHYTAWIPSEIATVGSIVRLKEDDGSWDDGWEVAETFTTQAWVKVAERSQDYKRTRKASDI